MSTTRTSPAPGDHSPLLAFRDAATRSTVGLYRPFQRFDLWQAYVLGARDSYRRHGVEHALMVPPATPESVSPYFVAVRDASGVVAGFQVNGPLSAPHEARALVEFAADPGGVELIRAQVDRTLADGVIEFKAAWVQVESPLRRELATLVARSFVHTLRALRMRHGLCTAATHAAPRWMTSGGRHLPGLAETDYPDERYSTTLLWWDVDQIDAMVPALASHDLVHDTEPRPVPEETTRP